MPARRPLARLVVSTSLLGLALAACSPREDPPAPAPACLGLWDACTAPQQCCSASCTLGTCDCSPLAGRCSTSNDCCDSFTARRCMAGSCVDGCRPNGDVCSWNWDCCSNNCDATDHCAPPCVGDGAPCAASSNCCAGRGCPAGTCTINCWPGGPCTSSNECCSGHGCRGGFCQDGYCGTWGQYCSSQAECCTFAQSGKNYRCEIPAGWTYGTCELSAVHEACATDADCQPIYGCRGGYCRYADRSALDGWSCLDGLECASGVCTSTQVGVPGICCLGAGASCNSTWINPGCCSPLACTGAAGSTTCGACLGPDNSGPAQAWQCTTTTQCCEGQSLRCETGDGKCCKQGGAGCTATSQCCAGDTCGSVTTAQATQAACCREFQGDCSGSPCCDGNRCVDVDPTAAYQFRCLKTAGQPCTASPECATGGACKIATPPTGACCLDQMERCQTNADCCSNVCNTWCSQAQPGGDCLKDWDCEKPPYSTYAGTVCGGNALQPLRCCPVPGQTCTVPTDCCEGTDDCQIPLNPNVLYVTPGTKLCCRAAQAFCTQDYECCTGACGGVPGSKKCCGFPYMFDFTCTSDADCCETGSPTTSRCDLTATPHARCCYNRGGQAGIGNAAQCCESNRGVDSLGYCK